MEAASAYVRGAAGYEQPVGPASSAIAEVDPVTAAIVPKPTLAAAVVPEPAVAAESAAKSICLLVSVLPVSVEIEQTTTSSKWPLIPGASDRALSITCVLVGGRGRI